METTQYKLDKQLLESTNLTEIVDLLNRGANIEAVDLNKMTILMIASEKGLYDIVQFLLQRNANINHVNRYDKNALMYASMNGHLEIVKYLIENGAKVNYHLNTMTALIHASQNGHSEVVKLLIEKGAEVNRQHFFEESKIRSDSAFFEIHIHLYRKRAKFSGCTALLWASRAGHLETVKCLIEGGADVNSQSSIGRTALTYASKKGHLDMVKFLIQKGADVNRQCNEMWTALSYASKKGHLDVVKCLIDEGADVNSQNSDRNTALIIASVYGRLDVVKYLITIVADINSPGCFGWNALDWISKKNKKTHFEIAKILKENGAKKQLPEIYRIENGTVVKLQ